MNRVVGFSMNRGIYNFHKKKSSIGVDVELMSLLKVVSGVVVEISEDDVFI